MNLSRGEEVAVGLTVTEGKVKEGDLEGTGLRQMRTNA